MKVAVIGYGHVGMAVFRELQHESCIDELALVGRNVKRMKSEVSDCSDGFFLRDDSGPALSYGTYEETSGADVIVYAAGVLESKAGRERAMFDNAEITKQIISEVSEYNEDGIIISITNPLDVMALAATKATSRPSSKVIGSGNLLDSVRLRRAIAGKLGLRPSDIDAMVIGEHGPTAVALRSRIRICGKPLDEYLDECDIDRSYFEIERLNKVIGMAGNEIFNAKGYTCFGVSSCIAYIVRAIANDLGAVIPVATLATGQYGIEDIAISLPCVIGRDGVSEIRELAISDEEQHLLTLSAEKIRDSAQKLGL